MRKGRGREAKLSFSGHALVENRHGLLVELRVSEANGRCERQAALQMLKRKRTRQITVGADKGYDCADFVQGCRQANITPHVAQCTHRRSAIDARTVRHDGYAVSQRIRMRIEQVFGWIKSIGGLRRTRFKGRQGTQLAAHLIGAAYNLLRMAKLVASSP
jgi:IS5 family transposase